MDTDGTAAKSAEDTRLGRIGNPKIHEEVITMSQILTECNVVGINVKRMTGEMGLNSKPRKNIQVFLLTVQTQ